MEEEEEEEEDDDSTLHWHNWSTERPVRSFTKRLYIERKGLDSAVLKY
jgi:hypothetical protein